MTIWPCLASITNSGPVYQGLYTEVNHWVLSDSQIVFYHSIIFCNLALGLSQQTLQVSATRGLGCICIALLVILSTFSFPITQLCPGIH